MDFDDDRDPKSPLPSVQEPDAPSQGDDLARDEDGLPSDASERFTLHWEGRTVVLPPEVRFPGEPSLEEDLEAAEDRAEDLRTVAKMLREELYERAKRMSNPALWRERLDYYFAVQCGSETSDAFGGRIGRNGNAVRAWKKPTEEFIRTVSKQLQDTLRTVGDAPPELNPFRKRVSANPADPVVRQLADDLYDQWNTNTVYLRNLSHVEAAHGLYRRARDTAYRAQAYAESDFDVAMAWVVIGQRWWDLYKWNGQRSALENVEDSFRRSSEFDGSTHFALVNWLELSTQKGDWPTADRLCDRIRSNNETWSEETVEAARKYLNEARWTKRLEGRSAWRETMKKLKIRIWVMAVSVAPIAAAAVHGTGPSIVA